MMMMMMMMMISIYYYRFDIVSCRIGGVSIDIFRYIIVPVFVLEVQFYTLQSETLMSVEHRSQLRTYTKDVKINMRSIIKRFDERDIVCIANLQLICSCIWNYLALFGTK